MNKRITFPIVEESTSATLPNSTQFYPCAIILLSLWICCNNSHPPLPPPMLLSLWICRNNFPYPAGEHNPKRSNREMLNISTVNSEMVLTYCWTRDYDSITGHLWKWGARSWELSHICGWKQIIKWINWGQLLPLSERYWEVHYDSIPPDCPFSAYCPHLFPSLQVVQYDRIPSDICPFKS